MTALDPQAWADQLGISRAAVDLYLASDVVDLHVDTFIWHRVFGYDLLRRHGTGPLGARFFGHADIPRMIDARVGGAMWVITTNPLRTRKGKRDVFFENLATLTRLLSSHPQIALVQSVTEHRAARAAGKHAAWIGIQGGNALELSLDDFERPELRILSRITLMHFTRSRIGAPALPRLLEHGDQHLTDFGREYVRTLDQKRILVDLAHASRPTFWDVVEAHDRSLPLAVTHAGCDAVFPHFRNVTDEQLRAVADTGGVIGVMFQSSFLGDSSWSGRAASVVRHLEHIVRTVGEDHAALGSDFDGAIIPPRDLKSVLELPRLVELMLARGFSESTVQKILGQNALRMLAALRD